MVYVAVFIQELAANSGSSWMSWVLNLYVSDAVVNKVILKDNSIHVFALCASAKSF